MIKIHKSKDGQHYFTVQAANNKILVTSETYRSRQAAQRGADALVDAITHLQVSAKKQKAQEFAG